MSAPAPGETPDSAVIDQAVVWLSHLWSGSASDASRAEWRRWRDADPAHERAWRQIEAMDMRLARGLPSLTADGAMAALSAPDAGRRRALKTLSLLAVAGSGGWVAQRELPWPAWVADARTATGERRTLTLADGTAVTLNTDSAIDLAYDDAQRRLHLLRGEILVATATDGATPPRPFVVQTAAGQVRPVGTRFLVHQQGEASRVSVLQGAVELHPADHPAAPLRLDAGQAATFTAAGAESPQPLGTQAAWTDGVLIASNTRLDDFIADLRRYHPGRLGCDAAVADLRLSGTFPLAEVERIPLALTQVLPVRLYTFGPWWTRIGPIDRKNS